MNHTVAARIMHVGQTWSSGVLPHLQCRSLHHIVFGQRANKQSCMSGHTLTIEGCPPLQGSATGDAIHFAAAIQARGMFEAIMVARDGPSDKQFVIRFK